MSIFSTFSSSNAKILYFFFFIIDWVFSLLFRVVNRYLEKPINSKILKVCCFAFFQSSHKCPSCVQILSLYSKPISSYLWWRNPLSPFLYKMLSKNLKSRWQNLLTPLVIVNLLLRHKQSLVHFSKIFVSLVKKLCITM